MSKEDLAQFLEAIKQVREANTAPDDARRFLQRSGYLDEDGQVSEHYPAARAAQITHRD